MVSYDLHIHSTASDGVLDPPKIFEMAKQSHLYGISITDHDTIDALEICSNISSDYRIDFIPGIELSADFNDAEIHILGYYIDYKNKDFIDFLKSIQNERIIRVRNIIKLLNKLGYTITFDEVLQLSNNAFSIGRPHIARVLINNGYFSTIEEVFNTLLIPGKAAYIERHKISVQEAIKRIKNIGGIPVLAHPFLIKNFNTFDKINSIIHNFIDFGICGIEVYHPLHSDKEEQTLKTIALNNDLIITGGSDFHDLKSLGIKGVSYEEIKKLKNYMR